MGRAGNVWVWECACWSAVAMMLDREAMVVKLSLQMTPLLTPFLQACFVAPVPSLDAPSSSTAPAAGGHIPVLLPTTRRGIFTLVSASWTGACFGSMSAPERVSIVFVVHRPSNFSPWLITSIFASCLRCVPCSSPRNWTVSRFLSFDSSSLWV